VNNPASPLVYHLGDDVQVTSSPSAFTVGVPLASADNAFTVYGDGTKSPVFGYDSGAALGTGSATARRVAFFLDDDGGDTQGGSTAENLNQTGWDIFGAAVNWATNRGDVPPGAPTRLTAIGHASDITLTWTGSFGATSYKVYGSVFRGGPYSIETTTTGTSYVDRSVVSGKPYYYVVTAVNNAGEGNNSNEATGASGCSVPAAPTGFTATGGDTRATLVWTAVQSANSYKVKVSATSGSGYANVATGVTTSSFVNTGLVNGTPYYYVVSAVNACGEGADSAEVAATPNPAAGAPATLVATPSTGRIVLTWAAGANATSYDVMRSFTTGAETLLQNVATTSFTDTGVTDGQVYYYVVKSRNSASVSAASNEASAVSGAAMVATPTFSHSTGAATTVTFSSTTGGATFTYTTDGTTPSASNGTAGTSVAVTPPMTVKVYATKAGMTPSAVAAAIYTLTSADAHVRDAATTTNYGAANPFEVKLSTGTTNNRIAFIRFPLTGVGATVGSAKIRLFGNAVTTAKAYAVYGVASTTWTETGVTWATRPTIGAAQGGNVTVGLTAQYWDWDVTSYVQAQRTAGARELDFAVQQPSSSGDGPAVFNAKEAAASRPYLMITQLDGAGTTAAPAFSVAPGTYPVSKTITITSSTPGAAIRYTTDGSTPTSSTGTLYTAPVALTTTSTLKAIAYASGMADSTVASGAYTILRVLSYEGEAVFSAASGATAATQADAGASAGNHKQLASTAPAAYFEFALTDVVAGTYQVEITYKANNNRGACSVKVDGITLGADLDQYAPAVAYPTVSQGTVAMAAGTRTIRLTTTTKNGASGNWNLSVDRITLTPQ
jgi:fibronectin type 3 domain-containing protein